MTLTKQMKKDIVKHILEVVFDLPADSELHKALSRNNLFSLHSMLQLDDFECDDLEYEDNNQKTVKIKKGTAGLLKSFKAYVAYHNAIGQQIEDSDWKKITQDEFDQFWVRNVSTSSLSTAAAPARAPTAPDLVREFWRGIKRDTTQFIALRDDAAWDN